MKITGSDGIVAEVAPDHSIKVTATVQTDLNAITTEGRGWTLPIRQTGAANTNDNVVFHLQNTSDAPFDIMRMIVSSGEAGVWTLATGRTYTSGGTTLTLKQLNTSSGKTQSLAAYSGTAIVLGGTVDAVVYVRTAANSPIDLLKDAPIIAASSGLVELSFQGDAGGAEMTITPFIHGANPWELT